MSRSSKYQPGQSFNCWTLLKVHKNKGIFKCICGTEKELFLFSITSGDSKSCGCSKEMITEERSLNRVGLKFNSLTLMRKINARKSEFRCDCGVIKQIQTYLVIAGRTKSCGCLRYSRDVKSDISDAMKLKWKDPEFRKKFRNKLTGAEYLLQQVTKTSSARKKGHNLSAQDIQDIWDKQNGKCAYSGVNLIVKTYTNTKYRIAIPRYLVASIDRIDSNRGYVKDNIQIVSLTCNLAKNSMTDAEMKQFIKLIRSENGGAVGIC